MRDVGTPGSVISIADDVRRGLTAARKSLPPYLFYDAAGCELYDRITQLAEYYPARAEREIFETYADEIVARVSAPAGRAAQVPEAVVELGAGSASKTEVVLRALLRRRPTCLYVPVDVSLATLEHARRRLEATLPSVQVRLLATTHDHAVHAMNDVPGPALLLFIGSSVGNFEDAEASRLLAGCRGALGPETTVLLGTDLPKSPAVLVRAYDDGEGVTAAFNKNVLTRINRELGGHFALERFQHVAIWNPGESRVEMHLGSSVPHTVAIDALGLTVRFDAGETIHTESSIKYTLPRAERILNDAGFLLEQTFYDSERRFAVHLARAGLR